VLHCREQDEQRRCGEEGDDSTDELDKGRRREDKSLGRKGADQERKVNRAKNSDDHRGPQAEAHHQAIGHGLVDSL
jgi:hypothetical protein